MKGLNKLPKHIKEITDKLSIEDVEALHIYTIARRQQHLLETQQEFQNEHDLFLSRLAECGMCLDGANVIFLDDKKEINLERDSDKSSGKDYSKPSQKRLENAIKHPSNRYAVQWLLSNHQRYKLGGKQTGRADYEKELKNLQANDSNCEIKEVSPANYRCMLAVIKKPSDPIEKLCTLYNAGSPAAIWAVPTIIQQLES